MNPNPCRLRVGLLALLLIAPWSIAQEYPAFDFSVPAREPDVGYVPTPPKIVDAMLRLAGVGPGDLVYDLGSGDGRIVIAAARDYGARGVGIDINPRRIREARENAEREGVSDRVVFIQGDLFQEDISGASVVTLYLLRHLNLKLMPKLRSELKSGTRIVSHAFTMGDDWRPDRSQVIGEKYIYYWVVP